MLPGSIPYHPIQGQGHGGMKVAKMADFKFCLRQFACNQKTVNYDTPRQYLNFVGTDFYRAMHFSAKRGIAIACRLSVCLSVCNVGEL